MSRQEERTGRHCFRCSICGKYVIGWGNNPYPVTKGEDDECCDHCNATKVIPARIIDMRR